MSGRRNRNLVRLFTVSFNVFLDVFWVAAVRQEYLLAIWEEVERTLLRPGKGLEMSGRPLIPPVGIAEWEVMQSAGAIMYWQGDVFVGKSNLGSDTHIRQVTNMAGVIQPANSSIKTVISRHLPNAGRWDWGMSVGMGELDWNACLYTVWYSDSMTISSTQIKK